MTGRALAVLAGAYLRCFNVHIWFSGVDLSLATSSRHLAVNSSSAFILQFRAKTIRNRLIAHAAQAHCTGAPRVTAANQRTAASTVELNFMRAALTKTEESVNTSPTGL